MFDASHTLAYFKLGKKTFLVFMYLYNSKYSHDIILVVILCYAIEYEIGITTPSGMPLIIYLSSYCIIEIKNDYKRMF